MQRVSGGYTIIEVTIVLAVAGVLLISSITFLSGTENHNRFSQAMRDTQSKFQDWFNDIPTGFAGGQTGINIGNISCQIVSGNVTIDRRVVAGDSTSENPDCIYLGRAIQVPDIASHGHLTGEEYHIFSYPVVGRRISILPATAGQPVNDIVAADPVVVSGINRGTFKHGAANLIEDFTIPGSAKVLSVHSSANDSGVAVSSTSHLAGFYTSFNQSSVTGTGAESLVAYSYNLPDNHSPGGDIPGFIGSLFVDNCISATTAIAGCNQPPPLLKEWDICLGNDNNNDTAMLTISSSNGLGVSTKLEFKACS